MQWVANVTQTDSYVGLTNFNESTSHCDVHGGPFSRLVHYSSTGGFVLQYCHTTWYYWLVDSLGIIHG